MDSSNFNEELYKKDWRWQDGDLTVTRTTQWSAPGCHCGCSILCYTDKDGKLVKVEGDPQSAMTQGRLCMRCFDLVNQVYHEKRITTPLIRDRADRGKNTWREATWDEALDLIEQKVRQIWEEDEHHNGRSIIVTQGTGRNTMWTTRNLAYQAFDSPNVVSGFLSGDSCYVPRVAAMRMLSGGFMEADVSQFLEDHFDNPEYKIPDIIVVWGNDPLISNADGFYAPLLSDCVKRGSKIICVDPRVTWLGAKADYLLQLRPGTDAALALGMINVMIEEDLYDHEFVDKWCYGFDQLKERAAEFPLDRVEEITWVPKEKIAAAARLWATGGTSALKWGLALDQQCDGVGAAHAVLCAEALTGSIEKPGGTVIATKGKHVDHPYDINDFSFDQNGVIKDLWHDRVGTHGSYPFRKAPINGNGPCSDELLDFMEGHGQEYETNPFKIRMVVSLACNWISCMGAQQNRIHEAMKDIEFGVHIDAFMTPTAMMYGDVFLPCAMGPERDGLRDWFVPIRAITKVTQTGEAKSDDEIVYLIGKRLHPERYYWKDYLEMEDFFVHDVNTMASDLGFEPFHLKDLQERVTYYPPRSYNRHETGGLRADGGLGFETPSGRIEFYSNGYAQMGLEPIPWYQEPPRSPISTPELMEEYPFVLTTGHRTWEFFHSEHRNSEMLRSFHPDPLFEINPADAAEYDIEDGDWVYLENQFGKAKFKAHVTPSILKGVISCEHAWWFPERDPEDHGMGAFDVFESNANQLTSQGECGPSSYGSPYKSQICKIYKADDCKAVC